jgi:proline dehydrogenase
LSILRNFFIGLSTSESARNFVTHFPPARATARRFVAGETLDEAVAVVKELNSRGIKAILNHVGEAVTNRAEAEGAAREMEVILERIAAEKLDADITFKPSHVGLTFGRDFCFENVAGVVQRATEMGISVEIDIEASPDVDDTLFLYHRLCETIGGDIRQAIQTYLFRTPADVQKIIDRGGSIRLVKGAYQEPPEIAYQQRDGIVDASLRVMEQMLSPEAVEQGAYLALGSHDPVLIEALLREAAARHIPPDRYEIQMLLGVRRDEQQRLADLGYQVRVYVPFGSAWYPYFMRRLAERPANVFFMARAMVGR